MAEIQRITIPQKHTTSIFKKYKKSTQEELLTVIGGNADELQWVVAPKNQQQSEWSVQFDTSEIHQARQELTEKWHDTNDVWFVHNHNRASGHWFQFSDADLDAAKHLYEEQWVDRMWLVMNGESTEDLQIQHMIVANHEWELHDLEWEAWNWKVITMVTDKQWETHEIYSESIEQAEELERQIVALKELLFEKEEQVNIAA